MICYKLNIVGEVEVAELYFSLQIAYRKAILWVYLSQIFRVNNSVLFICEMYTLIINSFPRISDILDSPNELQNV